MTDAEKLIEVLKSNAELIRENAALLSRLEKYKAVAVAAREVAIEVTGFSFESGAPQPLTRAVKRLDEALSALNAPAQKEEGS